MDKQTTSESKIYRNLTKNGQAFTFNMNDKDEVYFNIMNGEVQKGSKKWVESSKKKESITLDQYELVKLLNVLTEKKVEDVIFHNFNGTVKNFSFKWAELTSKSKTGDTIKRKVFGMMLSGLKITIEQNEAKFLIRDIIKAIRIKENITYEEIVIENYIINNFNCSNLIKT